MMLYSKDSKYAPVFEEYEERRKKFNSTLMHAGVKAFRPHDGWVNPDMHHITFFNDTLHWNPSSAYYHPKDTVLQVGDLLFIGDSTSGGRFARIDEVFDRTDGSYEYRYIPLYDTVDGYEDKFITEYNYPTIHTPFFERLKYRFGIYEPKFQKDII